MKLPKIRKLIRAKIRRMTPEWELQMQKKKLEGLEILLKEAQEQKALLEKIEKNTRK